MADSSSVRIALVESPADFDRIFAIEAAGFAVQTADNLWMTAHPGWQDPANAPKFAQNRARRWELTTSDKHGRPNAIFLKAIVNENGEDKIAGAAIWVQASADPSLGDVPLDYDGHYRLWKTLYPDSERDAVFVTRAMMGMQAFRRAVAQEKAGTEQPAWMVLDMCAVHPDYQGRGIAKKLVEWGLEEAKRRGGLECTTEGSIMGRRVYSKLGFARGPEIDYMVGEEFKDRSLPSNMIMRNGGTFS